jgi:hypothetical protein
MFDRVEKHRKKCIKKATPITGEQWLELKKVLFKLGLSYTIFFNGDKKTDDMVICLSNDTFIVKDYFGEN